MSSSLEILLILLGKKLKLLICVCIFVLLSSCHGDEYGSRCKVSWHGRCGGLERGGIERAAGNACYAEPLLCCHALSELMDASQIPSCTMKQFLTRVSSPDRDSSARVSTLAASQVLNVKPLLTRCNRQASQA